MGALHIVQGGVENGDKAWLERAARLNWSWKSWVVPKSVAPGDGAVIFVPGYGFFATARITSFATPKKNWLNRYGGGIASIKLIRPPISLGTIRRKIPGLKWARYPRSLTTPSPKLAERIRELVAERRMTRIPDLDEKTLDEANIDELRAVALLGARASISPKRREVLSRARSQAIARYVLLRSNGYCEGCGKPAPFRKADGNPYLEPHHTTRLADEGPDHPARVIALCPTCHRRAHYAIDSQTFNRSLKEKLLRLEARRAT